MPLRTSTFFQLFLPLALDLQQDGSYVVLNRRYKPLGLNVLEEIDYDSVPVRIRFRDPLTDELIASLSFNGSTEPKRIVLYDEKSSPLAKTVVGLEYWARLSLLSELTILH